MKTKSVKQVTLRNIRVPNFFGSTKAKNILVPPISKNETETVVERSYQIPRWYWFWASLVLLAWMAYTGALTIEFEFVTTNSYETLPD